MQSSIEKMTEGFILREEVMKHLKANDVNNIEILHVDYVQTMITIQYLHCPYICLKILPGIKHNLLYLNIYASQISV